MSQYVAVDLGAESGRVVLGTIERGQLTLREIHRFANGPVSLPDGLRWDVLRLWSEVKRGIAEAAAQVLQEEGPGYFAQVGVGGARMAVIDAPAVWPVPRSLRERLDLPLRLFLALLAGLALTFLLDYLDDTVRDRRELETMGLTVLAEIPPSPGTRWLPWRRPKWP